MRKGYRFLLLVLFMVFSILPVRANEYARVTGPNRIWMKPGETTKIQLETEDFEEGVNTVTYRLTNTKSDCVTLSSDGTLTANSYGSNSVEVTLDNGYQTYISVTISPDPEAVTFDQRGLVDGKLVLNLNSSEIRNVYASGEPKEAVNCKLTYYSENTSIVRMEGNAVYPVSVGQTRLVAEADNGVKGYLDVIVRDGNYAERIQADKPTIIITTKGALRLLSFCIIRLVPRKAPSRALSRVRSSPREYPLYRCR